MPFTMPQAQGNPTWPAQAVPDATDFAVITAGEAGNGVVSGLGTVVASAAAYTYKVTVSAGTYLVSGVLYTLSGNTTVTGTVAGANDRRDLVTVSGQTVTITAGTPCSTSNWTTTSQVDPPIKPSIPVNNVAVSEVYVPGSGSYGAGPTSGWVTDKSLTLLNNQFLALSGGTMTGAVNMSSNKITGLASGTATGDAATYGQITSFSGTTSLQYTTTAVSVTNTWRVVPSGGASGTTMSGNFTGRQCLFIFTCNQGGNATSPDVQIRLLMSGTPTAPTQLGSTNGYYLIGNTANINTRSLYGTSGILDFGSVSNWTVVPYVQTATAAGATLGQFQLTLLALPY